MDEKRQAASEVARTLAGAGYRALFAGGCVRDLLLEKTPKDWDIATSAPAEAVRSLFPKTVPVGVKFGVVLVVHRGFPFEVTTFRSEAGYSDGRHPDRVKPADRPEEDARRRDFTINGLFLDPADDTVLDFVGGREDLGRRLVRAIGDPRERFAEDHLRMLRAVRFCAELGFELEDGTAAAVKDLAPDIAFISKERIRDELLKIMTAPGRRRGVERMQALGLLETILPEVSAMEGVEQPASFHPEGDVFQHTLRMLEIADHPSATLALGILLHDVGKPVTATQSDRIRFNKHAREGARIASSIGRRLRLSNAMRDRVVSLVKDHMRFMDIRKMRPSTLKRFLRQEGFEEHLELHRLDCLASHGNLQNHAFAVERLETLGEEELRPPPLITGRDLMDLRLPRGPLYGRILKDIEEEQLMGRIGTKDQALARALEIAEETLREEEGA